MPVFSCPRRVCFVDTNPPAPLPYSPFWFSAPISRTQIDISNNQIYSIPDDIHELTSMEVLIATKNRLFLGALGGAKAGEGGGGLDGERKTDDMLCWRGWPFVCCREPFCHPCAHHHLPGGSTSRRHDHSSLALRPRRQNRSTRSWRGASTSTRWSSAPICWSTFPLSPPPCRSSPPSISETTKSRCASLRV